MEIQKMFVSIKKKNIILSHMNLTVMYKTSIYLRSQSKMFKYFTKKKPFYSDLISNNEILINNFQIRSIWD